MRNLIAYNLGRLGKAKVYDYQDIHIPVLVASAKARERVFESINQSI